MTRGPSQVPRHLLLRGIIMLKNTKRYGAERPDHAKSGREGH
jgi:hypothetical protein